MTWTHSFALGVGLAVGLWLGAQTEAHLTWPVCVALGILLFGACELGDHMAGAAVGAITGRRGRGEG